MAFACLCNQNLIACLTYSKNNCSKWMCKLETQSTVIEGKYCSRAELYILKRAIILKKDSHCLPFLLEMMPSIFPPEHVKSVANHTWVVCTHLRKETYTFTEYSDRNIVLLLLNSTIQFFHLCKTYLFDWLHQALF